MLILLLHWMKRLNLSVGVFILDSLAIVCSVIISNKHGQRKSSTSISHAYFSTHWIEKHNLSALVLGGFVIIFDVIAWVTRRDPSKFHKLKTCQTNQQQKGSCIGLYFDLSFIDQPEKHLLTEWASLTQNFWTYFQKMWLEIFFFWPNILRPWK